MMEGLLKPEDLLKEIIKLQLKKPKRWNWELSTSKSSPHICLPVIQLFDSKGKLLVEARDTAGKGATERRTWHSAQIQTQINGAAVVVSNGRLRRYDSDNLSKKRVPDIEIKEKRKGQQGKLRKSNSDVWSAVRPSATPAVGAVEGEPRERARTARQYKRTRSDDVYKRMLKHNESDRINENYIQSEDADFDAKYEKRTCNAGTIIVKRDSLDLATIRRRRRGRHGADDRGRSTAAATATAADRYKSVEQPYAVNRRAKGLSISAGIPEKFDNDGYYVVEEPSDSDCRDKGPEERAYNSRTAGISTSSGTADSLRRELKARVAKTHIDSKSEKNGAELERLVRRLSTDEDVKMGANVSRHSSKGLSGRRTQSSGSICKGRRNNENQICGSLPSYLDDREASCNNNHDYEKLPINDVDRIPPLGDGAPLHWKFSDNQTVLCDQGYGSERSPEEEYPPPLPEHDNQCHHHLDIHSCYPFITPESTFCVSLAKSSRGLGLSVTGGIDSGGSWPGLIRVKRLFPHQPAAACGVLNVGDLILEANGIALTGLTNYEALEVLRTSPSQVELRICRPPPDVLNCVSPISEVPPPPPRREPPSSLSLTPGHLSSDDDQYSGEFEITMRKIQGSLGFTLWKEDDSALGHYIRALVREPALNDGRIRPGDKIIAVNDIEISSMSHEEAVQFLRKCGDLVKLRLYRDAAQTPVATLSPTETTPRTSFSRKAQLRQEAVDMLNDIAVRKLLPNQDSYRHPHSPSSSPRRIRSRQNCPSDASQDSTSHYHPMEEQFHEGLLQHGGHLPLDEETFNSLFIHDDEDGDRPSRPSSLELYNPNQTPVACRKPKFNFSLAHNAYELNNLDAEILDAPNLTYNIGDDVNSTEVECGDSFPKEPASMPHLPSDSATFSYKNPAYQSAHPPCGSENGMVDDKKTAEETKKKVETAEEPEKKPRRKKSIKETKTVPEEPQILAIELNRGWNSRLGFSLQGPTGQTYVSAVHADSVAARDGRIKAGDRVIKVNDESVEHMSTNEIIELLRIVRGPVCIVVIRKPTRDSTRSNAAAN